MGELNKERLGAFIAQLRKERDLTQKELADRLFVSDKAVSKWERGLSVPDVSLLMPLAELLEVTTTELLQGERLTSSQMKTEQVEELVTNAIHLTREEKREEDLGRRRVWKGLWVLCTVIAAVEVLLLWQLAVPLEELQAHVILVEGLTLVFGGYFCFFIKDRLPDYYDSNPISAYSDGIFRMNLPGVRFTNRNWPHIISAGRGWLLGMAVIFPGLYLLVRSVFSASGMLAVTLIAGLNFLIPMMWAGKKYE